MMFCRSCGAEFASPQAIMCVRCGVKKGIGTAFCSHCGQATPPGTTACEKCQTPLAPSGIGKSKLAGGLLGIFLGACGVHNFYLGRIPRAVTQLTITVLGIIGLVVGPLLFIWVDVNSYNYDVENVLGSVIGFLISYLVGILAIMGMSIWGLIEGILILVGRIDKDGRGIPLSD
jgi:TM2 domain-containing membrane protein YozV/ribosomal protein L40E